MLAWAWVLPSGEEGALAALGEQESAAQEVETAIPFRDGVVTIRSREQTSGGGVYQAKGNVSVRFRDVELLADSVTYDSNTEKATGDGHVTFRRKGEEIHSDSFSFDVKEKTGSFRGLHGRMEGFRFSTAVAGRESESVYVFEDGEITSCNKDHHPHWSFSCAHARVVKDGNATLKGSVLRLFGLPVFYLPWVKFPVPQEGRKTGLTFPSAGNSNIKGFEASESVYVVLGRSADVTLTGEYYSKRGFGVGTHFRAELSELTSIDFATYSVQDREDAGGSAFYTNSVFAFGDGFRGAVQMNLTTSMQFRQTWSDTFAGLVRPDEILHGDVIRTWDTFMVHAVLDRLRLYLPGSRYLGRSLPEGYVGVTGKQLADAPVWFYLDGRVSLLDKDVHWTSADSSVEESFNTPKPVVRMDVHPSLFLPFHLGDLLRVTVVPSLRATYYSDSLPPAVPGEEDSPTTSSRVLFRRMAALEVNVDGPRLYGFWHFGDVTLKHVMEFGATWRWQSHTDSLERVIRFDSVDILTNTNEVEYYFVNRWFGKRGDGSSREWARLCLRQKYFADPDFGGDLEYGRDNRISPWLSFSPYSSPSVPRRFSPLQAEFAFSPASGVSGEARVEYDSVHKQVGAWSVSATCARDWIFTSLAYIRVKNLDLDLMRNHYLQSSFGLGRKGKGLSGEFNVAYNMDTSKVENIYVRLDYHLDCIGLSAEYIRYNLVGRPNDNEIRFSLYLRGVGEFGPLRNMGRRWY